MLMNFTFKKIGLACMSLAMFSMLFMTVGCSDDKDNPVSNNQDKIVTITAPDGEEYQISQAEIDKFTAESETYETMIEAMDPYVIENKDGTYNFDVDGFLATNPKMNELNNKVYSELTKGIPIVNQKIQEQNRSGAPAATGFWAQWHWWGITYCYTGYLAYLSIAMITTTGKIPYVGWIIPLTFGSWAAYLTGTYGGFCTNQTWNGAIWLSAP